MTKDYLAIAGRAGGMFLKTIVFAIGAVAFIIGALLFGLIKAFSEAKR